MTTKPLFSTPERDRDHPRVGHWPVLARLPDVSDYLPPPTRERDRSATTTRTTNYRFDPPEMPGPRTDHDASSAAIRPLTQTATGQFSLRPPQPHLFHHSNRGDFPARAQRGDSPILPRFDPFSIPASTFQDALAPFIRFVMLVALFTVAGTMVLTIGNRHQASPEKPAPNATAIQQQLEPANSTNRVASTTDATATTPTATGPSGPAATLHLDPWPEETAADQNSPTSPTLNPEDAPAQAARDATEAPTGMASPELDLPLPPATGSDDSGLPHVRTADPPAAVARLRGTIQQASTRQANNDDDQSSLY